MGVVCVKGQAAAYGDSSLHNGNVIHQLSQSLHDHNEVYRAAMPAQRPCVWCNATSSPQYWSEASMHRTDSKLAVDIKAVDRCACVMSDARQASSGLLTQS